MTSSKVVGDLQLGDKKVTLNHLVCRLNFHPLVSLDSKAEHQAAKKELEDASDMLVPWAWLEVWGVACPVQEVRINGDRINGLFHLLINGVYWVDNPLILTFDPSFLGHPSVWIFETVFVRVIMAIQPTPPTYPPREIGV